MSKRYTVEIRLVEVTEDGDTMPNEDVGVTLDYATEDYDTLYRMMSVAYESLEELMSLNFDDLTTRRPEDET